MKPFARYLVSLLLAALMMVAGHAVVVGSQEPATALIASAQPTSTLIPTDTARPTASTTNAEPTPTVESTIAPPTSGPTLPPKTCSLRSAQPDGSPISIRQGPTTGTANMDKWERGKELAFSAFVQTRDYLWGKSAAGYMVVRDIGLGIWWVYGTSTSSLCSEVTGWPTGLRPPGAFAKGGPHILMGEGGSAPIPYAANLGAAKCLDGAFQVCLEIKQINPDVFIIARHLEDSPSPWHYDHPRAWWDHIKNGLPAGFDAYEIENESPADRALYAQWVNFSIEMAKIVYQERGGILLAFSFGPGTPDYQDWSLLIPYLEWVATNPTPDGRYHGIAWHAAPYAPFKRADMPWVNEPHLAGRELFVREVILANGGPDLKTWPGQFWVTEIGLGDGYSGSWKVPYSCQEAAAAYEETLRRYGADGIIDGITWWNFGVLGWASDHDCADEMFVRLQ